MSLKSAICTVVFATSSFSPGESSNPELDVSAAVPCRLPEVTVRDLGVVSFAAWLAGLRVPMGPLTLLPVCPAVACRGAKSDSPPVMLVCPLALRGAAPPKDALPA